MYVQPVDSPVAPLKMRAEELVPGFPCSCAEDGVECRHGCPSYRVFTGAASGICGSDLMSCADAVVLPVDDARRLASPVVRLGLRSDDQLSAFLELYGYWLQRGSIHWYAGSTGAVVLTPRKGERRPLPPGPGCAPPTAAG